MVVVVTELSASATAAPGVPAGCRYEGRRTGTRRRKKVEMAHCTHPVVVSLGSVTAYDTAEVAASSRTTFTQTYSTASATVAALTVGSDIAAFTDPPSAAEMALLRTFVNALKADILAMKQNDNKVIDTLQQFGYAV